MNNLNEPRLTAITRLKAIAANCPSELLDRPVLDAWGLSHLFGACQWISTTGAESAHRDVPLRDIVGLGRVNDAWYPGDTWREVVTKRLHGADWTDEVFEYFRGPIGDKDFPPSSARGRLELIEYGGAVFCANGNHRLPAAVCWLAQEVGDDACMRSVYTTICGVSKDRIKALIELRKHGPVSVAYGSMLNIAPIYIQGAPLPPWIIRVGEDTTAVKIYGVDETGELREIWRPVVGIRRLFISTSTQDKQNTGVLLNRAWSHVPELLLDTWTRHL